MKRGDGNDWPVAARSDSASGSLRLIIPDSIGSLSWMCCMDHNSIQNFKELENKKPFNDLNWFKTRPVTVPLR